MMVRQAVLKGKDPMKLLEEMEAIDRMGWYSELAIYLKITNHMAVYPVRQYTHCN